MRLTNHDFLTYFNMHTQKDQTPQMKEELWKARKENPQLDRTLYQFDMAKMHEEIFKTDEIARKIAIGESITKEEEEFIKKVDPNKLKEAEMAKQCVKEIKQKLQNAKNSSEANQIVNQALSEAQLNIKSGNDKYAAMFVKAINEMLKCEEKHNTSIVDHQSEKSLASLKNYINRKHFKQSFNYKV